MNAWKQTHTGWANPGTERDKSGRNLGTKRIESGSNPGAKRIFQVTAGGHKVQFHEIFELSACKIILRSFNDSVNGGMRQLTFHRMTSTPKNFGGNSGSRI